MAFCTKCGAHLVEGAAYCECGLPVAASSGSMSDFLAFRRMVTPIIIQIVFWIGVAVCVISGLIAMVSGATSQFGGGAQILIGLLLLVGGPIVVRIYCELLILLFRMNETLTDIKNALAGPKV